MTPSSPLRNVLQATGFLVDHTPAPGLTLNPPNMSRRSGFQVDAIWHDRSGIEVVFKAAPSAPDPKEIASWHKEVWNLGVAPLLWIVSPQKIEIYNTFERPLSDENAKAHRLKTFQTLDAELQRLDDYAGRLSMLSGRFWTNERRVDRERELAGHDVPHLLVLMEVLMQRRARVDFVVPERHGLGSEEASVPAWLRFA